MVCEPVPAGPIMVVSDSQVPFGTDCLETQLPCSPNQLPTTDVALATIQKAHQHEDDLQHEVEKQVGYYAGRDKDIIIYKVVFEYLFDPLLHAESCQVI